MYFETLVSRLHAWGMSQQNLKLRSSPEWNLNLPNIVRSLTTGSISWSTLPLHLLCVKFQGFSRSFLDQDGDEEQSSKYKLMWWSWVLWILHPWGSICQGLQKFHLFQSSLRPHPYDELTFLASMGLSLLAIHGCWDNLWRIRWESVNCSKRLHRRQICEGCECFTSKEWKFEVTV